jgi:peptidoglycan/LPS O-acetylase OafA/YrhL
MHLSPLPSGYGGPQITLPGHYSEFKKRDRSLDFLRGIAILLVLAAHFQLEIPETLFFGSFFRFFNRIGWVGVDMFFVLSGFLVGGLLITELQKHGQIDVKRFLIRRGLKIYPLYYVFFGYLFFVPVVKAMVQGRDGWEAFSELWKLYWPNLLFINNYVGSNPIGHTWTLAIEEHFYLILPFLLHACSNRLSIKQITIAVAALVVSIVAFRFYCVANFTAVGHPLKETHFRIDALFLGVGVRGIAEGWPNMFRRLGDFRYVFIAVGFATLAYVPFMAGSSKLTYGYLLATISAAAVLTGVYHMRHVDLPSAAQFFMEPVSAVVCWVGTYSYSIYLWHPTIFRIMERQVTNRLGYNAADENAMILWVAAAVVITVATVLLSALVSRLVEVPTLRFRDQLFPSRSSSIPA